MSYFDHVQCSSCGARMNPEQLSPGRGEMPACPYCNANLNLADLFGVKDSFVGMHDDEGNDHSLDDLVGGELYDNRYADGRAPAAAPAPRAAPRAAPRSTNRPPTRKSLRALTGPSSGTNAMVPRNSPASSEPPASSGGQPSAMDLLREMKKKR